MAYAARHGGGTVAVSSQSAAARPIVSSGADVAALGGFSGRESEVDAAWLAAAVRDGRIRWVLADGGGMGGPGGGPPAGGGPGAGASLRRGAVPGPGTAAGPPGDGRVGASRLMAAVAETCERVQVPGRSSSGATGGLYDCRGRADALDGVTPR